MRTVARPLFALLLLSFLLSISLIEETQVPAIRFAYLPAQKLSGRERQITQWHVCASATMRIRCWAGGTSVNKFSSCIPQWGRVRRKPLESDERYHK